jgi:hypothetical protein
VPNQGLSSLYESLGDTVDIARQIRVDLGGRPYQVTAVRVRWSGGSRGRGTAERVFETPLVPTPRVVNLEAVIRETHEAGLRERGDIRIDEISPRYTEAQLLSYFGPEMDNESEEGFIEIQIDDRDGQTVRRRFVIEGVPVRRPDRFDWTIRLKKQDMDRNDDGSVPQGDRPCATL